MFRRPKNKVRKESFTFPSRDGQTELHALAWIPDRELCGLLYICHGLNEYMERYDTFARQLAEEGFLVFGADLLGHGLSAAYDEDLGYFAARRGDDYVLADIVMLSRNFRNAYPDIPFFLLGEGMGSYFVRRYLFTWPEEADGAILLATSGLSPFQARLKQLGLAFRGFWRKDRWRPRAQSSAQGRLPHRSDYRWLMDEKLSNGADGGDPYSDFVPSLRLYTDLNHSLMILADEEKLIEMNVRSPIFILYAPNDSMGRGAVEAKRLAILYKQAGLEYVSLKAYYEDGRESLENRDAVRGDILTWLKAGSEMISEKGKGK